VPGSYPDVDVAAFVSRAPMSDCQQRHRNARAFVAKER
jgi:hypothetical protein